MNRALRGLTQIGGFILVIIAVVQIAVRLRDGAWSELGLILLACLGAVGFGLGLGPLLGLWETAEVDAAAGSGNEPDEGESDETDSEEGSSDT